MLGYDILGRVGDQITSWCFGFRMTYLFSEDRCVADGAVSDRNGVGSRRSSSDPIAEEYEGGLRNRRPRLRPSRVEHAKRIIKYESIKNSLLRFLE